MARGIIHVDIADNEPENPKDRILETYYLLYPNPNKLEALQKAIEQRFDDENSEFNGLWDIREYVTRNFICLDIERKEIKW